MRKDERRFWIRSDPRTWPSPCVGGDGHVGIRRRANGGVNPSGDVSPRGVRTWRCSEDSTRGSCVSVAIAYDAFERSRQGKPAVVPHGGFTPEQRFLLSDAETWRFKLREETVRARLLTDEHAPPRYRVLGPLANLPALAAAFNDKAGDAMVRPSRDRPNNW